MNDNNVPLRVDIYFANFFSLVISTKTNDSAIFGNILINKCFRSKGLTRNGVLWQTRDTGHISFKLELIKS